MSCRHLLFTILFSLSANALCRAQAIVPEQPIIDESVIECVYDHRIRDYDIGFETNRLEILQIGKKYVQFRCYNSYIVDSIVKSYRPEELTYQAYCDIKRPYRIVQPAVFLIDNKDKKLFYGERTPLMGSNIYYNITLSKLKWTLHDEEIVVLGYKCRKATATYAGRDWTAWYVPEIRYGYGPAFLRDLPGLALEAYDSKGVHHFYAKAIRTKPSHIVKNVILVYGDELSREKFLKTAEDLILHAADGLWQAHKEDSANHPRPALKHFLYAPYELE